MGKVVVGQIAAGEDRVDQLQTGGGTIAHRDGDGAVQLDDRRGLGAQEQIIKSSDLAPIGGARGWGICVNRRDRRLQGVGAETLRRERLPYQRKALGNLFAVPKRAVLILEQDDLALGGGSGGAAGFL